MNNYYITGREKNKGIFTDEARGATIEEAIAMSKKYQDWIAIYEVQLASYVNNNIGE